MYAPVRWLQPCVVHVHHAQLTNPYHACLKQGPIQQGTPFHIRTPPVHTAAQLKRLLQPPTPPHALCMYVTPPTPVSLSCAQPELERLPPSHPNVALIDSARAYALAASGRMALAYEGLVAAKVCSWLLGARTHCAACMRVAIITTACCGCLRCIALPLHPTTAQHPTKRLMLAYSASLMLCSPPDWRLRACLAHFTHFCRHCKQQLHSRIYEHCAQHDQQLVV